MTQRLGSATIFSLAPDLPSAFATDPAGHAELDTAMLVTVDGRIACSIRKLSAAGATLHLEADAALAEATALELANGQSLPGSIAWSDKSEAGFLFAEPIDVIGTLARNLVALSVERRRVPRVELNQTMSIRHGGHVEFTRARNISQGGAGFETRLPLQPGDKIEAIFDGLRPLDALVKWARDGQAGVAFDEELPWQTLMPWLRQVQNNPPQPRRHAIGHEHRGMIADKHAIRLDAPARVREGVRWWNVRIHGLTSHLVEFEARAPLSPGTAVWIALPHVGGAPASVLEAAGNHYLCEFRLPLRGHEINQITGRASALV